MATTSGPYAQQQQALRARRETLLAELRRELHGDDGLLGLRSHRDDTDPELSAPLDALDLAHALRDDAEFRRIEAALQRIDNGSYGSCADCGEPIEEHRLAAEPTALRCVGCQDRFERTHAGG